MRVGKCFSLALFIFSYLTALLPAAQAVSAGHLETKAFLEVRNLIDGLTRTHAPERVLVVLDLDNTILATDYDIGSEPWYLWQSSLIDTNRLDEGAVASTQDDLMTVSNWISTLTSMHPSEPRIPNDVQELAAKGVRFMLLTSRGTNSHDVTLRELRRNGLDLTEMAPGPRGGYGGLYMPYDVKKPEEFGLTKDDVTRFKLSVPVPVAYVHGVMMTGGQHKGTMLRTLLAKTGASFDAIVFVDDRAHHSVGMQEAFAGRPQQMHTVRYTHELARVEAFQASDKKAAKMQWCHLSQGLLEAFGRGVFRTCDLPAAK